MDAAQKMADTYHLSATAESISFSSHLTKCTQLLQNAIIKVQIHHQRILFVIDIKSKDNHFSCGPGLSEKVSRRAILDRFPEHDYENLLRSLKMS